MFGTWSTKEKVIEGETDTEASLPSATRTLVFIEHTWYENNETVPVIWSEVPKSIIQGGLGMVLWEVLKQAESCSAYLNCATRLRRDSIFMWMSSNMIKIYPSAIFFGVMKIHHFKKTQTSPMMTNEFNCSVNSTKQGWASLFVGN